MQYSSAVPKQFQVVLSAYNGISKVLHTPIKQIMDFDTTKYKSFAMAASGITRKPCRMI